MQAAWRYLHSTLFLVSFIGIKKRQQEEEL